MKLALALNNKEHEIELAIDGARVTGTIDGNPVEANAVQISPGIYSILIAGSAFEVRVEGAPEGLRVNVAGREYSADIRDPREWRRAGGSALETEGHQKVAAPMPGKVIRLLVKAGDKVEAGNGLLVVEAMKMQNEVRSPKSGTVERLVVSEGQAVTAGETLAVIT